MKKTTFVSLFLFAACVPDAPAGESEASSALSAPGGNQCAELTPEAFLALGALIDAGTVLSELDVAANGVNGRNALAAVTALEAYQNARGELDYLMVHYNDAVYDYEPPTVYYNVGAWTATAMRSVIEQLEDAIYFGSLSAVYHVSYEARDALEYALQGVETANELQARGTRCNVDAYFPQ
jgi:hypothetical protein